MPENLTGDANQVSLANPATTTVATAGEYRRRSNSLVQPFQKVAHWLEALRLKAVQVDPLTERVEVLEGTTLGSTFTRGISSPHGDNGNDVNKLSRTRGTDGGGANVSDWAGVRTVGPTGSGADIIWTALDVAGSGTLTLALSARLMHYNCFDVALFVGDASLADFTGLRPLLTLPNAGAAITTYCSFFCHQNRCPVPIQDQAFNQWR